MLFETGIGEIYYRKVGQGPHLSFLHGFCETSEVWNPVIDKLQEQYTCLLIDLPGFGQSKQAEIPSIAFQSELIRDLLLAEKVEKTLLFGHSMGGYIGLELLNRHPELLQAFALVHSTSFADTEEKKQNRQKSIDFVKENNTEAFLLQFAKNLVSVKNYRSLEDELKRIVLDTGKDTVIKASEAMMARTDHRETLASCALPILFLIGDEDQFFTPEDSYIQAANVNAASIELIPSCGHLSMLEKPELCIDAILRFIQFTEDLNA